MKRLASLLLTIPLAVACGDESDGPGTEPDAGPVLPDARVITELPDTGPRTPDHPAPTLVQVTPPSGPETGGTRVTLRGTSFIEPATVLFGGVEATNVVVLDEVSIAATTPAGAIGRVTVEVTTPGGTAELPDGYRYHLDLQITSIQPARVPEEGGVEVTIRGRGFDDNTIILFDRQPLIGAVVQDAETIRGFVPPLEPGRPEVRGLNPDADVRRSDLLFVFATPDVREMAPGFGPTTGGGEQRVLGDGFEDAEQLRVGGSIATDLARVTGEELSITAPVLPEGVHDVEVRNSDASGTLAGGYIAYVPNKDTKEILGVMPNRASSAGGDVIAIVGQGFVDGSSVQIGGQAADSVRWMSENVIMASVPAGLSVGAQDVTIATTTGSTITASGALRIYDPIVISRASPDSGPAAGGTEVSITGSGFTQDVEVRIGGVPLVNLTVNDSLITGTTQAGPHGLQDITVENADTRGVLEDGFRFEEAFSVIRIDPFEGSIAGNTYVSIIGRGLAATSSVTLDGVGPERIIYENGSVLSFRTPPHPSGWVDVELTSDAGDHTFNQGFLYYDPRIVTGGAWGGPIEGSVNVGVLNIGSGDPLPGMVVQLGIDGDLTLAAVTDANGVATISAPDIRGAYTVTVGQNEFEFVTYMQLRSRNLTVLTSRYPASPPEDAPIPPCPQGGTPPMVQGQGFKIKSGLDPVTMPGWVPLARCTYTWANMFSPNPPMPPTQVAFISRNGQEFVITPARAGTIAVYCVLGDFNETEQEFVPRRLAIVRQVPSTAEGVVSGLNLAFDIELNKTVELELDNAPAQNPGPTAYSAQAFINLGSEGAIPIDWLQQEPSEDGKKITLSFMPDLPGAQFFYRVGSYTDQGMGRLGIPSSEVIVQSGSELDDDAIQVGPFVQMPQDIKPKPGEIVYGGALSWSQPKPEPDVTSAFVLDSTFVGGSCCIDINMNGTCEDGEPVMGGGMPVQFRRWSIFGEGGLQSYMMPQMPPTINAFNYPATYFWVVQQAIAPRFDYNEFIYNQFSPFFWKAWSVSFSQFVTKEETQ